MFESFQTDEAKGLAVRRRFARQLPTKEEQKRRDSLSMTKEFSLFKIWSAKN